MKAAETNAIMLCADDYGIAPGVGAAIRDLLRAHRLSAVSCMTVFADFAREGPLLAPYEDRADFGLHLTLTAERPLAALLRDAYGGRLDRAAVAREIDGQIDSFKAVMARNPTFIDGHQHVHMLPGIRDHVLTRAAQLGAVVRVLRVPSPVRLARQPAPLKALAIAIMGHRLSRDALRRGIAANSEFRGARSFAESSPYGNLFARMIAGARNGCMIMCHPGLVDEVLASRDPVTRPREAEYRYLASEEFVQNLATSHLRLGRLPAR
jgi:hypothetical protein